MTMVRYIVLKLTYKDWLPLLVQKLAVECNFFIAFGSVKLINLLISTRNWTFLHWYFGYFICYCSTINWIIILKQLSYWISATNWRNGYITSLSCFSCPPKPKSFLQSTRLHINNVSNSFGTDIFTISSIISSVQFWNIK
jgi:hypothetical protein